MTLNTIKKSSLIKNLIFRAWLWDAGEKFKLIENYLNPNDKILDIGSGPGSVDLVLREKNFDVTAIDVQDLSFSSELKPEIFDGNNIPYKDNSFDVSLLLTVLHHSKDPEILIAEAKRVSRKIIIIEDIYVNSFQKYLTYFADSLINLEFFKHPHNNKTDSEWRNLFAEKNLKIEDIQFRKLFKLFRQVVYLIS